MKLKGGWKNILWVYYTRNLEKSTVTDLKGDFQINKYLPKLMKYLY